MSDDEIVASDIPRDTCWLVTFRFKNEHVTVWLPETCDRSVWLLRSSSTLIWPSVQFKFDLHRKSRLEEEEAYLE